MKKLGMLSALLAFCLLVGCGAEKPSSGAASSSAPGSSSASQSSDSAADKDACPLDVSDWKTLNVEDTTQEPGSAYFTAPVDEKFSSQLASLWEEAEWEKIEPLEAGTSEIFYLEGEDGALLSLSILSDREVMAALKTPGSDQWECWKFSGFWEAYDQLARELLDRQEK